MSDTPTPETEAKAFMSWRWDTSKCDYGPAGEVVPADFARRLERERDESRAEVARLKKDSERLDWLLSQMDGGFLPANNCVAWHITHYDYGNRYPSRSAIDEALAAVRGEEEGK